MKSTLLHRIGPGRALRSGTLIAAVLATLTACYQVPPSGTPGEMTGTPVDQGNTLLPRSDPNTPTTGENGNPYPGSSDNVQNANANVGMMTIASASNPYLCLSATSVQSGSPVMLGNCSQNSNQMWLLSNGHLMLTPKLCLTPVSEGSSAEETTPILGACDPNSVKQTMARGTTGGLVMYTGLKSFGLTATLPTASTSNVTLNALDPNHLGQKWILGADTASSGNLQLGGFHISPTLAQGRCLVGDATGVVFAACDQSAAQSWRWDASAQLTNSAGCLTAKAGAAIMAPCTADANQVWLSINSQLTNQSVALCMDVDVQAKTPDSSPVKLITCPTDGQGRVTFGGGTL